MENILKIPIILIIIIFLTILAIIFLFNFSITGNAVKDNNYDYTKNYTYTKAICNSSNYCQDYEIKCQGNKTVSAAPVTGAAVQFENNWHDPRNNSEKDLC